MKKDTPAPAAAEDRHVNGWPVIRRYLELRCRTQSALAAELGISPSAVSQLKQGGFLLNPAQLDRIADFLQMDPEGVTAFYAQIFRARLLTPDPRAERGFALHFAPVPDVAPECPAEWLEEYEPAAGSLVNHLLRRGIRVRDRVRVIGVAGAGPLTVRPADDPRPGDTVLLKVRGAPCRFLKLVDWTRGGGRFDDGGSVFGLPFSRIMWIRPAEVSR